MPQGPFGESHGHIALEDSNLSMQIAAITMRGNPVFVSFVSQLSPSESSVLRKIARAPHGAALPRARGGKVAKQFGEEPQPPRLTARAPRDGHHPGWSAPDGAPAAARQRGGMRPERPARDIEKP